MSMSMSMTTMPSGIQGQLLDVTVVGCSKLKDTEWISRQDPYVCLEYASTKFRTRTCTDGGKHPTFQEKTVIPLIEGLREITVTVWNSNTLTFDDFIGSGRIQLQKVLSQGYDDSSWSLQSKSGKYAGEVKLIMHFANANAAQKPQKTAPAYPSSPYMTAGAPSPYTAGAPSPYMAAGQPAYAPMPMYAPTKSVDTAPAYQPPAAVPYPPYGQPAAYPPPEPAAYNPASIYPPPPMQHQAYPPQAYPPPPDGYPTQPYPPPLAQAQPYYPPGHYPGTYPPPY